MSTYTPGQKVTITLDPEYAKESSYMDAPSATFEAVYEHRTDVEVMPHRAYYIGALSGLHVSRTFTDEEVSAA